MDNLEVQIRIPEDDGILESVILNRFSVDPGFIAKFSGALDDDIFISSSSKKLYKMVKLFQSKYPGHKINFKALQKVAGSNKEMIEAIKIVAEVPEFPTEMVYEETSMFIRRKRLELALVDGWDNVKNPALYPAIEAQIKSALTCVTTEDLGTNYFDDAHIRNRYARKRDTTVGSVRTMYPGIDDTLLETNKACARGTLNVISGQSNIGKSIWLGQLAINGTIQKKDVAIVTLEMGEDSYASRIDCNIVKIPTEHLTDENLVCERLADYKKSNECSLQIKQMPTGGASPLDILNYANSLKMRGIDLDMLVIDYINLMRPNAQLSSSANSYERVKVIAEELRAVAIELDIPIWTATQLNRAGYDTVPTNANTSESMGLVHTADFILGVYQEDGDKTAGMMRGVIMKNRYGPVDIFLRFGINYPTLTITSDGDTFEPTNNDKDIQQRLSDEMAGKATLMGDDEEIPITTNLEGLL